VSGVRLTEGFTLRQTVHGGLTTYEGWPVNTPRRSLSRTADTT
jgi:hypothetical protein